VPLPWSGNRPPFGFSPPSTTSTWLEQPVEWSALAVAAQEADPESMLWLYRAGLLKRRNRLAPDPGPLDWLASPEPVLAFRRGPRFACYVNFGPDPIELPSGAAVLVASLRLEGGRLPSDACVWLELPSPS
jgi:alpha-glucosidase